LIIAPTGVGSLYLMGGGFLFFWDFVFVFDIYYNRLIGFQ